MSTLSRRGTTDSTCVAGLMATPLRIPTSSEELERPERVPRGLNVKQQLGHACSDERVERVLGMLDHQVRTTWKT